MVLRFEDIVISLSNFPKIKIPSVLKNQELACISNKPYESGSISQRILRILHKF